MKAPRVVLIVAGVLATLVLIAVLVALNSSVQTWAARRVLAQQRDVTGTLGSLSAGLRRVEVRDLHVESRGALLTLPSLDADISLVSAGLREKVHIEQLVAKGWTLDLSRITDATAVTELMDDPGAQAERMVRPFSLLSSAYAADVAMAASAAKPVFEGVFAQLRLPVDLTIDSIVLEGEVILPQFGGMNGRRVKLTLTGGGLAEGRTGSFVLDLAAASLDGGALSLRSTIEAAMDTPRTFTQLAVKSAASASGPQIPRGVTLDIQGATTREASGERYSLHLATAGKPLVDVDAALESAASRIAGNWKLDLQESDIAAFMLGKPLPSFVTAGQGTFQTDTTFGEIHARGQLNGSVERLEAVQRELSAIGRVSFTADFDVLQHGDALRVERLNVTAASAAPLAVVRALQPFEFNLKSAELRVADPAQDLVQVSLSGVPLVWAEPFLGDLDLHGGELRGEFTASARDGGLALRAKNPLTMNGLTIASSGEELLRNVDVSLTASADYTPQGWQAQVARLDVRSQGAALLSLEAKAGQLAGENQPVKATGRWNASLPAWAAQPVLKDQLQVAAGRVEGDFSGSFDGTKAVEARIAAKELKAATGEVLPTVAIEVRADVTPDGGTTFKVPVLFTQAGRKSDLLLAGTLHANAAGATAIDARLSSELIITEDVQLLALLVPASAPEEPTKEAPGSEPFWNKLTGEVTVALKKIVYGGTFEVTDAGGSIRIGPSALTLDGIRAAFGPESDLRLTGGLKFDPAVAQAYVLEAEMAVNNFDTAPAFRAIDPAKLPTVEARVNLATHVSGRGASLGEVVEQAQGKVEISSKGGVFRALSTVLPGDRAQFAQSALTSLGGLLGGSTGDTVAAASEIVKMVSEIQFDQMSVRAGRDESSNFVLHDFSLISPNVRLGGSGQLVYAPGKPVLQQTLDMQLTLGARGPLAEMLEKVKLLKPEKDNLGYSAFSAPIRIGGTLANTDTSDFRTKLLNVAMEKSGVGEALNKILGGGK